MTAERTHTFLLVRREGRNERVIVWDTQDISLGRAPENDLVLEEPEVSRNHACFVRAGQAYTVRNMSLSNPTAVNGAAITTHELKHRDKVECGGVEFVFCQSTRNPVTLGLPVEHASQHKGFPVQASGDGEATILGLTTEASSDGEDFVVRPAADFEHELQGVELPPRDLDLELSGEGEAAFRVEPQRSEQRRAAAAAASGTVQLTLEIEGLEGASRSAVEGLLGKVFELPRLRIRVKGLDLG